MDNALTEPFVVGESVFAVNTWTIDESTPEDQPGFGIDLRWWHPEQKHKPYVVVSFWRWRVQVGWVLW